MSGLTGGGSEEVIIGAFMKPSKPAGGGGCHRQLTVIYSMYVRYSLQGVVVVAAAAAVVVVVVVVAEVRSDCVLVSYYNCGLTG
jgi:hypothetical protein